MNGFRWRTQACVLAGLGLGCLLWTGCGIVHGGGDSDQARVIMTRVAPTGETETLVCSEAREPFSLGSVLNVVMSPDGRFAAIERSNGVAVLSLATLAEVPLPTEGASLVRARWSPASDRLAYFAGGVPQLVSSDGNWSRSIDVEVPLASGDYQYQAAEWSADGQQVAFATRRWGILTDRDGEAPFVFSEKVVGPYGTPWALSFSADGQTLAALQTEEPEGETRTVLLLDIASQEEREFEGISHYSFVGWAADDSGVMLWDTTVNLWFVPRDGGEPRSWNDATGFPSPNDPVVALTGPGLPIEGLHDGSVRTLLQAEVDVSNLRWEAQGEILWYAATSGSGYLRVSDGASLLRTSTPTEVGVVSDDGWVVLVDPDDPGSLLMRDLLGATASPTRMAWGRPEGGNSLLHVAQWLQDGRLAFHGSDGLHLVSTDGSDDQIICPAGIVLVYPQVDGFDRR